MDNKEYHARVLFRWTERLTAGLPPIVIGAGAQTMDMLHVEDVARANILAAISPVSDVALNVGSGKETSLLTLARILARVMDRPDLEPVFWEGRTNLVARRVADIDAARRTIGFESSVSLKDGLAGFVEWWRDRPATGIRRVRAAW